VWGHQFKEMQNLSIIIPVFEEKENIEKLVKYIKINLKIKNYEIIFIDDNSNDGTEEVLKKLNKKNKRVKYKIRKANIKDLSKSCIVGFNMSKYKNILVMDGDLQHDPRDIKKIISKFKTENADMVIGSRNLFNRENKGQPFYRIFTSKILILIISLFLRKKTNDPMSGFFIFKKEIYYKNKKSLYARGYKILFDLLYSTNDNIKVFDVDINFRGRSIGSSKMNLKILYILILMIIKKIFSKFS